LEASQRTVGKQYSPTYLNVWVQLVRVARLADVQKGFSQQSNKPTVNPVNLLQQFACDFDIVFTPSPTLITVLKNIHKNGVPSKCSKASYTVMELYTLTK